jgi:hypothetical protein
MLIRGTAASSDNNSRVEVAQDKFTNKENDGDVKGLELGMSFLQVKASMMQEKLRQGQCAIYVNNRQIIHTKLEAVTNADKLSLISIFVRVDTWLSNLEVPCQGLHQLRLCSDPTATLLRDDLFCSTELRCSRIPSAMLSS